MIYIVVFLNFHPFVRRLTKQMALIIVFTRVGCVRHLFYIYIILFSLHSCSSFWVSSSTTHNLLRLTRFYAQNGGGHPSAFSTINEIPRYRDIKPQKHLVYCRRWSVHLSVQKRTRYRPWLHSQALILISTCLPQAGFRINNVGCVAKKHFSLIKIALSFIFLWFFSVAFFFWGGRGNYENNEILSWLGSRSISWILFKYFSRLHLFQNDYHNAFVIVTIWHYILTRMRWI